MFTPKTIKAKASAHFRILKLTKNIQLNVTYLDQNNQINATYPDQNKRWILALADLLMFLMLHIRT